MFPNGPLVPVVGVEALMLRFGMAGVGWFRISVASSRKRRFILSRTLNALLMDVLNAQVPGFSMMF